MERNKSEKHGHVQRKVVETSSVVQMILVFF